MNKKQFYQTIHDLWQDLNNETLLTADAKEIFSFFKQLLKDVKTIHEKERHQHDFSKDSIYYLNENCDYYFVGDIHSDAFIIPGILDTIQFFEKVASQEPFKVIFLGDYVDRGHQHLKTVMMLMMLKKYFPENIYLLMGNHDIGHIEKGEVTLFLKKVEKDMAYFYIYLNELHQNHTSFDDELLDLFLDVMNNLNVTAFIQTDHCRIQGVHGGLPRPLNDTFDYISADHQLTDGTIDHEGTKIRDCLLWSDPSIQSNEPLKQGKRFKFYERHVNNYFDKMNLDLLVRGHQAVEDGHLFLFNKVHTIFSSGKIMKDGINVNKDTAYDFIPPKLLKLNHKKGLPLEVLNIKFCD